MNVLDCFSGIGGGILASKILGHRVVCAVEKDAYCQKVLIKNQNEGFLRPFPIWDNITTFNGFAWRGRVDLVQGGFPCQDLSIAGKRKGISGERSGLWFEMFRIICEVRPEWVFIENVANFLRLGLDTVLGCLAGVGYDAEWTILGADDIGANHHRKRLWLLAKNSDTVQPGLERVEQNESEKDTAFGLREDVCNAVSERRVTRRDNHKENDRSIVDATSQLNECGQWWQTEPDVGRLVGGFPNRVSALRGLGNAQVPLQAAMAFTILQRRFR